MTGENRSAGVPLGNGDCATPVEMVLMAIFLVYEAPMVPAVARSAARAVLTAVLRAATARGFPSKDIFETLLATGDRSPRVLQLAQSAADAVGDIDAFLKVIRSAGVSTEGDL